jgi:hypothetical protein
MVSFCTEQGIFCHFWPGRAESLKTQPVERQGVIDISGAVAPWHGCCLNSAAAKSEKSRADAMTALKTGAAL